MWGSTPEDGSFLVELTISLILLALVVLKVIGLGPIVGSDNISLKVEKVRDAGDKFVWCSVIRVENKVTNHGRTKSNKDH